ncbi:MAG: hypothetical protein OXG96_12380 [Acidobacteria bacterium]|nr:hypothetical protein [Acidobacteriota bacterium]
MPDKVLLVCSSTAANIRRAREILCGRTPSDPPELHLLCSPSDLPALRKEPPAGQIWVFPHRRDLAGGFRLWLRIRKQRYREVAVLWCGEKPRLRPKLFALACGGNRILVFDQRLECAPLGLSLLGRLLAARLRRLRPRPRRPGRLLPPAPVLLEPLAAAARLVVAGIGLLAQWLLIPVRFLLLLGSVLWLYARRRPRGEH